MVVIKYSPIRYNRREINATHVSSTLQSMTVSKLLFELSCATRIEMFSFCRIKIRFYREISDTRSHMSSPKGCGCDTSMRRRAVRSRQAFRYFDFMFHFFGSSLFQLPTRNSEEPLSQVTPNQP